jgi:DNA mismatch repair ATPase MutS
MKSLENYVSSNIEPIKGTSKLQVLLQGIRYFIIDRYTYHYLKESIIELVEYTNRFLRIFENFNAINLPALLSDILNEFKSFTGEPVFRILSEKTSRQRKLTFTEVYYFDGLLRSTHRDQLKKIVQLAYEMDALLSMAKATVEFGLCFPGIDIESNVKFETTGLYHLVLKNPKSYNVSITNENNFFFLTGPNMAGKTTFLKSIGIAVYLAHIGMSVPAQSMKTVLYDRLFTSLTVSDNIFSGYSYFFSEVKRVKQVAEAISRNEKVFTLFDELFKGTNVKDSYDASALIISGLIKWKHCLFMLSSHLAELENELKQYPGICYYYFESDIQNGLPVFNYRLKQGVSDTRLGMVIIKNEKIMELLNSKETNDNN